MLRKIKKFWRMDNADKINALLRYSTYVKTAFLYRSLLKRLGRHCLIGRPLYWNPNYIEIGDGCSIASGCRLEAVSRWGATRYTPCLHLGNHVSVEQYCHITFASTLTIGIGSTISFGVMITDIDHEYRLPDTDILCQPLIVRKTQIGPYCFIGAGAKIQAGTVLGRQCIVGANAVVRGVFPDYCVLVGSPARIVKRYNPSTGQWEATDHKGEFLDHV